MEILEILEQPAGDEGRAGRVANICRSNQTATSRQQTRGRQRHIHTYTHTPRGYRGRVGETIITSYIHRISYITTAFHIHLPLPPVLPCTPLVVLVRQCRGAGGTRPYLSLLCYCYCYIINYITRSLSIVSLVSKDSHPHSIHGIIVACVIHYIKQVQL